MTIPQLPRKIRARWGAVDMSLDSSSRLREVRLDRAALIYRMRLAQQDRATDCLAEVLARVIEVTIYDKEHSGIRTGAMDRKKSRPQFSRPPTSLRNSEPMRS